MRFDEVDMIALVDKLVDSFDPEKDEMDRRILFEVTGLKINSEEHFEGETSDEDAT